MILSKFSFIQAGHHSISGTPDNETRSLGFDSLRVGVPFFSTLTTAEAGSTRLRRFSQIFFSLRGVVFFGGWFALGFLG
jgi:hypothetical protein